MGHLAVDRSRPTASKMTGEEGRMKLKHILASVCMAATVVGTAAPSFAKTLEMGVFFSDKDALGDTMRSWIDQVRQKTDGRVEIKPVYNGALVKLTETLDAVRDDVVPMGVGLASLMSGVIPALGYTELVGAFPADPEKTGKAFADVWPHLVSGLAPQGVVPLWGESVFGTGVICRNKFLKSKADWKGLTVRAAGRWMSKQVTAMGAQPVTIDPGELYIALQNGTVDCALMNPAITVSMHLYEVAPYYTNLGLAANITMFLINKGVWDGLSEADRKTIDTLSKEAMAKSMPYLHGKMEEQFAEIKAKGGKVYDATGAERATFVKDSQPIFDEIGKVSGSLGKPISDVIERYR
jgi:TRAP-type C4-dicarboxylate transport system substrate-binding protein